MPNTMYVTVAGAGDKSGSSWANAMSLTEFQNDVINNAEAGDIYYVYSGTYTLTSNFTTAKNGSASAIISIIGVSDQETPPTEATGTDRPLFACSSYQFRIGQYWHVENLRFTITDYNGVMLNVAGILRNCKLEGSSARGCTMEDFVRVIDCEAISDVVGIYLSTYSAEAIGCYVHDSLIGIQAITHSVIEFCIIDTCSHSGIYIGISGNVKAHHNTIYNCDKGIYGTTGSRNFITNNIIDSCTTYGITWDSEYKSNYFDHNNYYNNGTDVNNVTKGSHATALDPQFVDAPNGDFRIGANLKAKGFPGAFPGTHASCIGYLDTGAVQRVEPVLDYPVESDVRKDTSYDSGSKTGTCAVPSANDTEDGVAVDDTVGNFKEPGIENVKKNTQYGAKGTEFTGIMQTVTIENDLELEIDSGEIEIDLEVE